MYQSAISSSLYAANVYVYGKPIASTVPRCNAVYVSDAGIVVGTAPIAFAARPIPPSALKRFPLKSETLLGGVPRPIYSYCGSIIDI